MGITLGKQMLEFSDLTVVDFSDLAQGCKAYDEFIDLYHRSAMAMNFVEIFLRNRE